MKKKVGFYEILVYISYAFFILFGLVWFIGSFSSGFNYQAFALVAVFSVQAWFRHKLTNLILGILALFLSIFTLLSVINIFNLMDKHATYDGFIKAMIGLSLLSMVFSVILMFSYTQLGFKDQQQ